MIDKLQDIIRNLAMLSDPQSQLKMFENVLIAKYGSYEAAQKEVLKLKEACKDDDEFNNGLAKLADIDTFERFIAPFRGSKSLIEMIENISSIENGEMNNTISDEDREMISNSLKSIKLSLYNDGYDLSLFTKEIAGKIKFTIKEIRDEIGVNQRTFTKWLQSAFGNKYAGRRRIDLYEYLEIHEMLLLKDDENCFDLRKNLDTYHDRIDMGLVFNKMRLAKLTSSDYKTLAANVKSVKHFKSIDKFPYRIAQAIIKDMS